MQKNSKYSDLKEGKHKSLLHKCGFAYSNFPPQGTVWKEQEKSNFIVEKPDKHHLTQKIKVNNNSYKSHYKSMYL